MTRPSWDEWALGIAAAVALRADCTRRQVGAVVLDLEHRILSTGYNGAPAGEPGCASSGACPRGRQPREEIDLWKCPRHDSRSLHYSKAGVECRVRLCRESGSRKVGVAPGSSYDTGAGSCIAVHAEANALLRADPVARQGGTLALTDEPCDGCWRIVKASGVGRVVWADGSWTR